MPDPLRCEEPSPAGHGLASLAVGDPTRSPAAFSRYLATTRRQRREIALISCAALAILAVFVLSSYGTIRENFSGPRLRTSAERVGRHLVDEATPLLIDVAKEVAPVYRSATSRGLEEALPALKGRVQAELELFVQHASTRSRQALEHALAAPIHDFVLAFSAEFPSLDDRRFTEELLALAEQELHAQTHGVLDAAGARYAPQVERLMAAFQSLHDEQLSTASTEVLTRRFLHLWLMLLDQEIMTVTDEGQVVFKGSTTVGHGG